MASNVFGEFFKQKRLALGLTLREFCRKNRFDWGNVSRLERGVSAPPKNSDVLEGYARALQIRPDTDAQPLADAARAAGLADVELVVVPNANHVYKREEAPFESLTPEAGNFYNADDRVLEPGVVSAIVGWLQRVDAQ